MENIINYLKENYHPLAILLYGSYKDGLNDEYSDYDCMIIVDHKDRSHDDSMIDGVQLDCFIYSQEEIKSESLDEFITIYDAVIAEDNGIGKELQSRVKEYIKEHTVTCKEDKQFIISWIQKTMKRTLKNDDEGNYRLINFLSLSLEDYFVLRDLYYFGSKKSIQYLKEHDQKGYELYHNALTNRTDDSIRAWANYLITI